MTKTGIVIEVNKKIAVIMTDSGEFINVKSSQKPPKLGEIYTSQEAIKIPIRKFISVAASIALIITTLYTSYIYNTVYAAVIININPSIQLCANRWNRIIKTNPLNSDGEKILASLKLKNKPINDGLNSIIEESKKQHFINDEYRESGKEIQVYVDGNSNKMDLSNFEKNMVKNNLKYKINNDSKSNPNDSSNKASIKGHGDNLKFENKPGKSKIDNPRNKPLKEDKIKNNPVNKTTTSDLKGNKNYRKDVKRSKKEQQRKIHERDKDNRHHSGDFKDNENE